MFITNVQKELIDTMDYNVTYYKSLDEFKKTENIDNSELEKLTDENWIDMINEIYKPYPDRFVAITSKEDIVEVLLTEMSDNNFKDIIELENEDSRSIGDYACIIDPNDNNAMLEQYLNYVNVSIINHGNYYTVIIDNN